MIQLLAAVGWGLLALGAITHIWHHRRLRELLAMHLDHERVPAFVLTFVEAVLAITIPVLLLTTTDLLMLPAIAAGVLAFGFAVWIARLLATGSELPCACSFSAGPTSWWSFGRSLAVGLVVLYAFVDGSATDELAVTVATLCTGLAIAGSLFVLPEALSWPTASRALLARIDAFDPATADAPDAVST